MDSIRKESEEEIDHLLKCISPCNRSNSKRREVAVFIKCVVGAHFPDAGFLECGSSLLRSYLPESDLDLVILLDSKVEDSAAIPGIFTALTSEIGRKEAGESKYKTMTIRNIELVNARTKVVHCLVNNIVVDLTINQIGSAGSAMFLEDADALIGKNHLFKRSLILIKNWCAHETVSYCGVSILGSKNSMFSSYAIAVMVLYVLNKYAHGTASADSGSGKHKHNRDVVHPLQVLKLFLTTYQEFPWDSCVLTLDGVRPIHNGGAAGGGGGQTDKGMYKQPLNYHNQFRCLLERNPLQTEIQKNHPHTHVDASPYNKFPLRAVNIQDPIDPLNNLGMSVARQNIRYIEQAMRGGLQHLEFLLSTYESTMENFRSQLRSLSQNNNNNSVSNAVAAGSDIQQGLYSGQYAGSHNSNGSANMPTVVKHGKKNKNRMSNVSGVHGGMGNALQQSPYGAGMTGAPMVPGNVGVGEAGQQQLYGVASQPQPFMMSPSQPTAQLPMYGMSPFVSPQQLQHVGFAGGAGTGGMFLPSPYNGGAGQPQQFMYFNSASPYLPHAPPSTPMMMSGTPLSMQSTPLMFQPPPPHNMAPSPLSLPQHSLPPPQLTLPPPQQQGSMSSNNAAHSRPLIPPLPLGGAVLLPSGNTIPQRTTPRSARESDYNSGIASSQDSITFQPLPPPPGTPSLSGYQTPSSVSTSGKHMLPKNNNTSASTTNHKESALHYVKNHWLLLNFFSHTLTFYKYANGEIVRPDLLDHPLQVSYAFQGEQNDVERSSGRNNGNNSSSGGMLGAGGGGSSTDLSGSALDDSYQRIEHDSNSTATATASNNYSINKLNNTNNINNINNNSNKNSITTEDPLAGDGERYRILLKDYLSNFQCSRMTFSKLPSNATISDEYPDDRSVVTSISALTMATELGSNGTAGGHAQNSPQIGDIIGSPVRSLGADLLYSPDRIGSSSNNYNGAGGGGSGGAVDGTGGGLLSAGRRPGAAAGIALMADTPPDQQSHTTATAAQPHEIEVEEVESELDADHHLQHHMLGPTSPKYPSSLPYDAFARLHIHNNLNTDHDVYPDHPQNNNINNTSTVDSVIRVSLNQSLLSADNSSINNNTTAAALSSSHLSNIDGAADHPNNNNVATLPPPHASKKSPHNKKKLKNNKETPPVVRIDTSATAEEATADAGSASSTRPAPAVPVVPLSSQSSASSSMSGYFNYSQNSSGMSNMSLGMRSRSSSQSSASKVTAAPSTGSSTAKKRKDAKTKNNKTNSTEPAAKAISTAVARDARPVQQNNNKSWLTQCQEALQLVWHELRTINIMEMKVIIVSVLLSIVVSFAILYHEQIFDTNAVARLIAYWSAPHNSTTEAKTIVKHDMPPVHITLDTMHNSNYPVLTASPEPETIKININNHNNEQNRASGNSGSGSSRGATHYNNTQSPSYHTLEAITHWVNAGSSLTIGDVSAAEPQHSTSNQNEDHSEENVYSLPKRSNTPRYQWTKDGLPISAALGGRQPYLNIFEASVADAGYYQCVKYVDGARYLVAETNLRVSVAPYVTNDRTRIDIDEGRPLRFVLDLHGIPYPTIQWYKNGYLLEGLTTAVVEYEVANESHGGGYNCFASNIAGSLTWRELTVVVHKVDEQEG